MSNLVVNFKQTAKYKAPISFSIKNPTMGTAPYSIDVVVRNQVSQDPSNPYTALVWEGTIPLTREDTILHGTLSAGLAGYIGDADSSHSYPLWMYLTCHNFSIPNAMAIYSHSGEDFFAPVADVGLVLPTVSPASYQWAVYMQRSNLTSPQHATLFNIVPPVIGIMNNSLGNITLTVGPVPTAISPTIQVNMGQTVTWNVVAGYTVPPVDQVGSGTILLVTATRDCTVNANGTLVAVKAHTQTNLGRIRYASNLIFN